MKRITRHLQSWFKDDLFRRLFKNAGTLLSGNVAASALGLVSTALTARLLGPETFGVLVLITTYALVVDKLVNFQSWQAIIKYGADALERDRTDDFGVLVRFGFLLDGGTAVVGTIIAATGAWFVGKWRGWDAEVVLMATVYSVTILFHVSGTPTAILRLFNKFKLFSAQAVIASGIKLIGVSIAYAFGAGLWVFLVVWALTDIVGKLLLVAFSMRELRVHSIDWSRVRTSTACSERFPKLWSFVLTTNLNSSIRMASREIDVFVIGALLSPTAVGLFKVAKQVSSLLGRLSDPLYQSIYPELARLAASNEIAQLKRLSVRAISVVGSTAMLCWSMTALFGTILLDLVFGSEYVAAYPVMIWYMGAIVLAIVTFPLTPIMLSFGQTVAALRNYIVSTAAYYGLLFLTIGTVGLVAGGSSYVGFYVVWITLTYLSVKRVLRSSREVSDE